MIEAVDQSAASARADGPGPNARRLPPGRAAGVCLLLAIALVGLAGRLVHINTVEAPRLLRVAEAQQHRAVILPARRGTIFDARGRVLAVSRLCDSVFADPHLVDRPDQAARRLAAVLDRSAGEIENAIRMSGAPRFRWLARRVADAQAAAVRALGLPGIGLQCEFQRSWPMGPVGAHVLGFVGNEQRGLAGLELVEDGHLRGTAGRRSMICDAARRPLRAGTGAFVEPVDGGHVVLTIDSVIQSIVQERLTAQVARYAADSGVAVVMRPATGEVLALASAPGFDPNTFGAFDAEARRNRVVTDPVEPGSVFKPIIASMALARGAVDPSEQFDCHQGEHIFDGRVIHDTKKKGLLDLRDILVYSSNIGMAHIGQRMGNAHLYDVLMHYGFGQTTQLGLPGESGGIVPPLPRWNRYSTTSVPMGHEVAVTPIQLATAFCAVVNGGYLLRPRIVRARLAADMSPVEVTDQPEIVRQVIPRAVSRYLTEDVLPGVVEHGGPHLDVDGYAMTGKTGTAEVPYTDRRGYEPDAYLASFMGAAPVDNPQLVVLVMILRPDARRGYYGKIVAGPVVRDVMTASLTYLRVPREAMVFTGLSPQSHIP